MNKKKVFLFCFALFVIACSNTQTETFEYSSDKTEADWINYFSEIGRDVTDLSQSHDLSDALLKL